MPVTPLATISGLSAACIAVCGLLLALAWRLSR